MHAIIVRLPFTPVAVSRHFLTAPRDKPLRTSEAVRVRRVSGIAVFKRDGVADLLKLEVDV